MAENRAIRVFRPDSFFCLVQPPGRELAEWESVNGGNAVSGPADPEMNWLKNNRTR
jgi:hypothetical protein